ncbi:hypothetical protein Agub_g9120 [Astrephomene gubernaculifera]|uniref:SET domain-containing protein n=1 Tax=Astrephomene gubernaculifera TaxID=47775 RepID=A0AAD3HNQ4_9CHLO|nr:hypothetical protein Agub_g9120 [Astrephomene gubernaculifera]
MQVTQQNCKAGCRRGVTFSRHHAYRSHCIHNPTRAPNHASISPLKAAAIATDVSADSWYTGPVAIPRQVDGIEIAMLQGKGRGMVATRDFAPGDVVMSTPPLVLVTSPHRQRPSGELVVDEILERKLYGSKWFSVLYDGSSRSCKPHFGFGAAAEADASGETAAAAAADAPRPAGPPEPMLASTSAPAASAAASKPTAAAAAAPKKKGFLASRAAARRTGAAAGGAAGGTATGSGSSAAEALPLPDKREQTRLAKIVKFNCFGDDAEDLAASACRGEEPRGHIGLWPEFALLNHSCAPNTVNFVVGGAMVVRAVRNIRAGEEVSISYLGRPQLLPFQRRMQALKEDYGFDCDCVRCTAEQAHYDKLDDVYLELFEAVEGKLGPAFLEARREGNMEAVAEVQQELQGWLRRLYGIFRKTLLAPDVRQYVIASMYDAYDLAFSCAAALGQGEDASSLQACLKAMEAVSAGSDLHVILAVRYFDWCVREHGEGSALTELARGSLRRAHVARYGPVSGEVMAKLVDNNRALHISTNNGTEA